MIYRRLNPTSGGNPSVVRNDGWPAARGRYVQFLDDDDRAAPGSHAALAAALDANPDRAFAFGRVEPFGGEAADMVHELAYFLDAAHRARRAHTSNSKAYMVSTLLFEPSPVVPGACLFRKSLLAGLGGFDPGVRLLGITDLCTRAARRHGFVFVDQAAAQYRFDRASLTHDVKNGDELRRSYHEIYRRYRASFGTLEFLALKGFSRTIKRFL